MERIASSSLDFLITSAVATVDVSAVAVDIAPLLILCVCGFIWNLVMLGCLSTFLLPNHWYVRRNPIMMVVLLSTISLSLVSYGQACAQMTSSQSHTPSNICVYEVWKWGIFIDSSIGLLQKKSTHPPPSPTDGILEILAGGGGGSKTLEIQVGGRIKLEKVTRFECLVRWHFSTLRSWK